MKMQKIKQQSDGISCVQTSPPSARVSYVQNRLLYKDDGFMGGHSMEKSGNTPFDN